MATGYSIARTEDDNGFPYFTSRADQHAYWYGEGMETVKSIKKAAGAMSISVPGVWNAIHGPAITNLQYTSANALGAIGSKPWSQSGLRVQTALSRSGNMGGKIGGSLPAKTRGQYAHITIPYREMVDTFAMNKADIQLYGKDDVIKWEQFVEFKAEDYINGIDIDLLKKVETAPAVDDGGVITNITPIDRIISSYSEAVGLSLTEGYESPWGGTDSSLYAYRNKTTGAASPFDCYVDNGGGTARPLSLSLIDGMFNGVMPYWKGDFSNKVFITGVDFIQKASVILQAQQRYAEHVSHEVTVDGIKSLPGRPGGFILNTYNNVPMLWDPNMSKDVLSRAYLVDKTNMWYSALVPTQTEVSVSALVNNSLTDAGVMYQFGEVVADRYGGLGKLSYTK